ncbi:MULTISPECIES: hypothetical protein [Acinetobacter calcoaceticus/baumannii complex]|uniref:hypothetical protein n=1 Tax=Acinetobacter calcoaceticus/baumannii complex TaxID=909768 RepID=UPI001E42AFB2|nr:MULTISPECIES: hypothetical protein [Acinetobacter calcoaceticus/baumannii complex]MDA3476620.1 hypothetical protein [Acinetobacter baumannii]MDP7872752.1 hypothetical protein [Acinetobacter pittii]UFN52518.1 hypothetical protein LPS07_13160 [Acinetobacter pittii]
MPNNQLDNQIKIINMLELFIFEKICSTPFLGSHESILMASNEEDLRKAIYTLDDEGHFKESEEDKIKRLCNKPVKVFFPDQDGNDQVAKLDFEYRPKHYHEVLQAIRQFRFSLKANALENIQTELKAIRTAYSSHADCMNQKNLPQILRHFLEQGISKSFNTYNFQRIRKQPFYNFVENYIQNYRGRKFSNLKQVYKDLDRRVPKVILQSIQNEINWLENFLKFMIDRHESCLIFDPRKAIIPLSVAEQISLLKQGKPISSTSFYSSQNLTDFQAQFESFNERKENIESRIKTLKHELETFNNPDAPFERSKAYLNERPDLKVKLKEKCIVNKKS